MTFFGEACDVCPQVVDAPASQIRRQLEERDPVRAADRPEVGHHAARRLELFQQPRKHCSGRERERCSTSIKVTPTSPVVFSHAHGTFFRLAWLLGLHPVCETPPQHCGEVASIAEERRAAAAHAGLPGQQHLPGSLDLWEDWGKCSPSFPSAKPFRERANKNFYKLSVGETVSFSSNKWLVRCSTSAWTAISCSSSCLLGLKWVSLNI